MRIPKRVNVRWIGSRVLGRHYGYGYAWGWDTVLDASGSEDFNEPYILKKGKDFIDGGSAWGFWSVRAARFYEHVIPVEPDWRLYLELRKNLSINHVKNAVPLYRALAATEGDQLFHYYGKGESSLLAEHMGRIATGESRWVKLATIDRICETGHFEPSVIKLDVESAERSAIMGGMATIVKYRPTLLVEVHHPVVPEDIERLVPFYNWTRRWRYLNMDVYPFEKQPHLLGVPK